MERRPARSQPPTPNHHSNRPNALDIETVPRLPTLDPGLTILESEGRAVGPLDSLVLDHLLRATGDAVWVDSGDHATTRNLARLAPSPSLLERIRVARGFTAYQGFSLVERLCASFPPTASFVVVPWVDALYREGDISDAESAQMLGTVAQRLEVLAETHEVPVLVTRREADELTHPFDACASRTISCQATRFGPRFVGEGFETLVYKDGQAVQTTLAFWAHVLDHRQAMHTDVSTPGVV